MKRKHLWVRRLLLVALGAFAWRSVPLPADAAPGAGYTLDWWTVDGGGQTAPAGTGYTLEGTIGQPDAAVWEGDGYTLAGGFWVPDGSVSPPRWWVYLPLVVRNHQ